MVPIEFVRIESNRQVSQTNRLSLRVLDMYAASLPDSEQHSSFETNFVQSRAKSSFFGVLGSIKIILSRVLKMLFTDDIFCIKS